MEQKKLHNQRGFSLIEILVAMAVLGIMSAGMMTMISDQNKANKSTQLTMETNELYAKVQRYMLNSSVCGETLNNVVLATGAQTPLTEIKKGGSAVVSTSAPNNQLGGVAIKNMTLQRKTGTQSSELDLVMTFEKINKGTSFGGDTFSRTITLQGTFDTVVTNKVVGCYSQLESAVDTAREMSCKDLCPTCWDATAKTCIMDSNSKLIETAREQSCKDICATCWDAGTKKCTITSSSKAIYEDALTGNISFKPTPTYQNFVNETGTCGKKIFACPGGTTYLGQNGRGCENRSGCGLNGNYHCFADCRRTTGTSSPVGFLISQ